MSLQNEIDDRTMERLGGKLEINAIDDAKTVMGGTHESANEMWKFDVTWNASRLQFEGDHARE